MSDISTTVRFEQDPSQIAKNEAMAAADVARPLPEQALNTADNRLTPVVDIPRTIPARFSSVRQLVDQAEQSQVDQQISPEHIAGAIQLGVNIEGWRDAA